MRNEGNLSENNGRRAGEDRMNEKDSEDRQTVLGNWIREMMQRKEPSI